MSDTEGKLDSPVESRGVREDIDENTPASDVKAPNVLERVQEEIGAIFETIHPHKEANDNISPSNETNRRDEATTAGLKMEKPEASQVSKPGYSNLSLKSLFQSFIEKDGKGPNLFEKAKEGFDAIMHKSRPPPHHHHKETHGRSDDIDENTSINEVKGPNMFERAKEEIEAIVEAFHHKNESPKSDHPPKKEGGFQMSVSKGLEKVCSPFGHKKD